MGSRTLCARAARPEDWPTIWQFMRRMSRCWRDVLMGAEGVPHHPTAGFIGLHIMHRLRDASSQEDRAKAKGGRS